MRTTIEINDDIYHSIVKAYGKRKISITINEILASHFKKKKRKKSMFGADPWLKKVRTDDLRDEDDRNT
jgi:predicted CopG family antitoxin